MVDYKEITEVDKASLDYNQKQVLDDAILSRSAHAIGTGLGAVMAGGVSIFIIISSFVGGLLGWLLTMKEKVLQCLNCGAVVSAS